MDHNSFCFRQIYFFFVLTKKHEITLMHSGVSGGYLAYVRHRTHSTEYAGKIKECRIGKDLEGGSHVITSLKVLFLDS
jgi:hypothetical protein